MNRFVLPLLAALALSAGCANVNDFDTPSTLQVSRITCAADQTLPNDDPATDSHLFELVVSGSVAGSNTAEMSVDSPTLGWGISLSCPDWGGNCARDDFEAASTDFRASVELESDSPSTSIEVDLVVRAPDVGGNDQDATRTIYVSCPSS